MFDKIIQLCNDNHDFLIAAIIVVVIGLLGYGCESTVTSMLNPEQKVNRAMLQTEVDYFLAQAQNRFDELDRQDQIRLMLFDKAALFAETGVINPTGLLTTAISIFAVGSALDQRRQKIEAQKKTT